MKTIQFFSIQYVILDLEGIVLESFNDLGKFEPKQKQVTFGFSQKNDLQTKLF